MGSRSKTDRAYIAGFLDGDGSIMLQIKKRSDTKRGVRFMATICLYQDTRHGKPLYWIRDQLEIGYISKRGDGISELRINGFKQVRNILTKLKPYIQFKQVQTDALIGACEILASKNINKLNKKELRKIVDLAFKIKKENYASRSSQTKEEFYEILGLTP